MLYFILGKSGFAKFQKTFHYLFFAISVKNDFTLVSVNPGNSSVAETGMMDAGSY